MEINQILVETSVACQERKTCRLCTGENLNMKNIFEEKIENVPASVAIMECIYPIEVRPV